MTTPPPAGPTAERVCRVRVRGFGFEVIHLAQVPESAIAPYTYWGSAFDGIAKPVVALCGSRVRSVRPVVVVMHPDSKVSCRYCLRHHREREGA